MLRIDFGSMAQTRGNAPRRRFQAFVHSVDALHARAPVLSATIRPFWRGRVNIVGAGLNEYDFCVTIITCGIKRSLFKVALRANEVSGLDNHGNLFGRWSRNNLRNPRLMNTPNDVTSAIALGPDKSIIRIAVLYNSHYVFCMVSQEAKINVANFFLDFAQCQNLDFIPNLWHWVFFLVSGRHHRWRIFVTVRKWGALLRTPSGENPYKFRFLALALCGKPFIIAIDVCADESHRMIHVKFCLCGKLAPIQFGWRNHDVVRQRDGVSNL